MLILFYKPSCPFCHRVLAVIEDLHIQVQLRDTGMDPVAKKELLEKGGKTQVPFLIDTEREVSLYESGDIVAYLEKYYADNATKDSFQGVRIHKSDDTCQSCQ